MYTKVCLVLIVVLCYSLVFGCLITNCPRGGRKRNGKLEGDIQPCTSCGPGLTGQCFGPNICCGQFGCLIGTTDTLKCKYEGLFNGPEPCIAGNSSCKWKHGRCATQGVCCNQESCFMDKSCTFNDDSPTKLFKAKISPDIYGILHRNLDYSLDK